MDQEIYELPQTPEQRAQIAFDMAVQRERALANFYAAERNAGACPLVANERMMEFSKRLDAMEANKRAADDAFNRDLEVIRQCMERK